MIDSSKVYILILVEVTLTFIQGCRCARKQQTYGPIISQNFQSIWILLYLVGLMNLMLIYFVWEIFKGESPILGGTN